MIDSPQNISENHDQFTTKKKRSLVWLVLAITILIIGGLVASSRYLVKSILIYEVSEKTNGEYLLDFDKVNIKWFERQVIVREASFHYVGDKVDSVSNTSIEVKKIFIDVHRLADIYYRKELNITSILIEEPEIWINKNSKTKSSFSFASGNLYKAVNGVVNRFELKNLDVNHLKLHYTQGQPQQELTVNDISFNIRNFNLDSTAISTKQDFFFTESFELKVANQSFDLPATKEKIHFDSLLISTSRNIVEVYNLTLDTTGKQMANTQFKLLLPYAGFVGVNFLKAYQTNVLEVDSLLLTSPELFGRYLQLTEEKVRKLSKNNNPDKSAVEGVLQVFESIQLHRLVLDNAQLKGEFLEDLKASVNQLDIDVNGFQIDSSDLENEKYFPRYDSFSVSIKKPDFALNKNTQIVASSLSYKSSSEQLLLDSARIEMKASESDSGELRALDILVQQIALEGISSEELMKKEISLNNLTVNRPVGDIALLMKVDSSKSETKIEWYKPILTQIDRSVSFNQLRIVQAKLKVYDAATNARVGNVSGFNLRLSNVQLNKKTSLNHLVARSGLFVSRASWNLNRQQHKLSVSDLRFKGYANWVTIGKLAIEPNVSDSATLPFISNSYLEELELKANSIGRLVAKSDMYLSRVALNKAVVNHHVLNTADNKKKQNVSPFKLGQVAINDVNVRVTNPQGTVVKFDSLYVMSHEIDVYPATDTTKLDVIADSLTYGAENVFLPLRKIKHMVSVGKIAHQTDTMSYVSNLSIRPLLGQRVPDSLMKMNVFVPKLLFEDNKVFEGKKSDSMEISSIAIEQPIIRLRLPNKSKETTQKESFNAALPFLNTLDVTHVIIDDFEVNGAQLSLAKENGDSSIRVSIGAMDLISKGWDFNRNELFDSGKILWADSLALSLANIATQLPKISFCHNLDSVTLNFTPESNALSVNGIYLNNNALTNETALSAYIPRVELVDVQIAEMLNNKNILVDSVLIKQPSIDGVFRSNKEVNSSSNSEPFNWRAPKKLGGYNNISVKRLELQQVNPNLATEKNNELTPIEIGSVNLAVDSFEMQPNSPMDSVDVLWSKSVSMTVEDVYTTVDNGLYGIELGNLHLSTKQKQVQLSSVKFKPTVYRYEYALHKGYRKDVFDINGESIHISELDFYKAITHKEFDLQSIWLKDIEMNILKDKRIPLPAYKYKAIIPEMFKRLPVTISTDTIGVSNLDITYEEFPSEGRSPGQITLTDMEVYALNATNDTVKLLQDSTLNIFMNAKFLDAGDLHLELNYNMLDSLNAFTMHTTLGEMDGTLINAYLVPAFRVEVNSLNVEKMEMNAIGNDTVSGGLMGFFYDDLKFTFLKENDRGQWLKTTVGNTIIGKNKRYHALRKGKPVYFKRDDSKGWIGYLIRIELSGIQSNVGLASYNKDLKAIDKKLWKEFIKEDKKNRKAKAKEEKKKAKEKKKENKKEK